MPGYKALQDMTGSQEVLIGFINDKNVYCA